MRTLKIHFADFWKDFDQENNFLVDALKDNFNLVIDERNPDLLLCSNFGNSHFEYDTVKLHYTGENIAPDFNLFDYSIGHHKLNYDDRYLRWPFWRTSNDIINRIQNRRKIDESELATKKFCNFIYSNSQADPIRDRFFHALNKIKPVDSLGRHLKNTKGDITPRKNSNWQYGKIQVLHNYKFTICFENSSVNGYTTEKLIDAHMGQTVPIYWGNPSIEENINPDALIIIDDERNFDKIIDKILHIDGDNKSYLKMVNEPLFLNNKIPPALTDPILKEFLKNVGDQSLNGIRYVSNYGNMKIYQGKQKLASIPKQKNKGLRKIFAKLF